MNATELPMTKGATIFLSVCVLLTLLNWVAGLCVILATGPPQLQQFRLPLELPL